MKKFKEKLKKHFQNVMEIKKSPSEIALGFAIGTVLAILPTFGLAILFGLLIISIFEKVSKISMFIAFLVWNPFVLALLFPLHYYLGNLILGDFPIVEYEISFLEQVFRYTRRFLVGNLIVSSVIGFISYWVVYFSSKFYQAKRI